MTPEPATITPYRDGPLLVRGPFRLQDMNGNEIATDRQVVALCRCGKSRIRPLCDGSHKLSSFRAPSGLERRPRNVPPPPRKPQLRGDSRPVDPRP